MFSASDYKRMLRRMRPLMKRVVVRVKVGDGYRPYLVNAHVSRWQERDVIPGGTIETGDLKLIIPADDLPNNLRRLEQKDRVDIGDRSYAVIHWDSETRAMGESVIAIEATVR